MVGGGARDLCGDDGTIDKRIDGFRLKKLNRIQKKRSSRFLMSEIEIRRKSEKESLLATRAFSTIDFDIYD